MKIGLIGDEYMAVYEWKTNVAPLYKKEARTRDKRWGYTSVKRGTDILVSAVGCGVGFIPMAVCGLLIKLEDGGPIVYRQTRLGQDKRPFQIYKLRTMRTDAEKDGAQWAAKDDQRVTKIGRFLRRTHLDELPQFFNILKGDMSLIGPRPERPELTDHFESEIPGFTNRLMVKPGLTGLAQVNGGYDISPEEKLRYDLEYIWNQNVFLDVKILMQTVWVTLTGKGAR